MSNTRGKNTDKTWRLKAAHSTPLEKLAPHWVDLHCFKINNYSVCLLFFYFKECIRACAVQLHCETDSSALCRTDIQFEMVSRSVVVCAVEALAGLVVGKSLQEIVGDFRGFYRLLTSDGQMRWVRQDHSCLDANVSDAVF